MRYTLIVLFGLLSTPAIAEPRFSCQPIETDMYFSGPQQILISGVGSLSGSHELNVSLRRFVENEETSEMTLASEPLNSAEVKVLKIAEFVSDQYTEHGIVTNRVARKVHAVHFEIKAPGKTLCLESTGGCTLEASETLRDYTTCTERQYIKRN